MRRRPTKKHARNQLNRATQEPEKLPFIAHVYELRKRLFYSAVFVTLFSLLAATVRQHLTNILLKPAGSQQFIYTSPGGGFDFAFRICLYTGIAFSIPVIVYNFLRYLEPLFKAETMRFILGVSAWSGILAAIGIVFGYYLGLPNGLHFLLHGFSNNRIEALISIQAYLAFVLAYLLGSALLFQIPLLLIVTNHVKPLKPKKLMSYQRWVILLAFVVGALIAPSPDVRSQTTMSLPIILMYEISVIIIWTVNRKYRKPKHLAELLRKDAEIQANRLVNFEKARAAWRQTVQTAIPAAQPQQSSAPLAATSQANPPTARPRKYVQDFNRRPYRTFMGQTVRT